MQVAQPANPCLVYRFFSKNCSIASNGPLGRADACPTWDGVRFGMQRRCDRPLSPVAERFLTQIRSAG